MPLSSESDESSPLSSESDEFSAFEHALIVASHELRTPLTVIYGVLRTLQRPATEVDAELRAELVATALLQVERMMTLIEKVIARGPEAAGASYADHMPHTV